MPKRAIPAAIASKVAVLEKAREEHAHVGIEAISVRTNLGTVQEDLAGTAVVEEALRDMKAGVVGAVAKLVSLSVMPIGQAHTGTSE